MYEVITRRYTRLIDEEAEMPDLIIVDGGKGQLSAACDALKAIGLYGQVPIIGIAKRLEEIYFPEDSLPLYIDKKSESLKLIQQLRDEAHRFGLPCGGTIQLAIEPLSAHSRIDELITNLGQGELVARRVDLQSGEVTLGPAKPGMSLQVSEAALTTIHGPRWRLLIIGAGQLSRFLAQIAVGMDYAVTVCDPREEYRDGWSVEGVQVVHAMPDDLVMDMRLDSRSAVVALTHDPKLDDLALMEALKSEAFYVGAIGSRSNDQKRRERLLEFDLTPEQLAKLHGPIGIYIGSKTPSEIAISILAELTAVKNSVELPDIMQVRTAKEAANTEASPDACLLDPSQRIV
jgi:xanthine dehydrogenase accessory factor